MNTRRTPRTHYHNLQVAEHAGPEVIRAAYRQLCKKWHPDRAVEKEESERVMRIINRAYEVLSDPEQRARHDRWIADARSSEGAANYGWGESAYYSDFSEHDRSDDDLYDDGFSQAHTHTGDDAAYEAESHARFTGKISCSLGLLKAGLLSAANKATFAIVMLWGWTLMWSSLAGTLPDFWSTFLVFGGVSVLWGQAYDVPDPLIERILSSLLGAITTGVLALPIAVIVAAVLGGLVPALGSWAFTGYLMMAGFMMGAFCVRLSFWFAI